MSCADRALDLQIEVTQNTRSHEVAAVHTDAAEPPGAAWPMSPGGIRRHPSGRLQALHFAPGRWLVPAADADTLQELEQHANSGRIVLFEVSGKWQQITLHGHAAERLLASGTTVDWVLRERDCAALTLFDTPAILSRRPDAFDVWIPTSYLSSFLLAIARLANQAH